MKILVDPNGRNLHSKWMVVPDVETFFSYVVDTEPEVVSIQYDYGPDGLNGLDLLEGLRTLSVHGKLEQLPVIMIHAGTAEERKMLQESINKLLSPGCPAKFQAPIEPVMPAPPT